MSSVCDLGTIRNIIRGVDEPPPHTLLCEIIDDAEHSKSKKVFVDIDTRNRCVVFGFENAATEEQLTKMVQWNPVSTNHGSSDISTCGQGMKYYEFRFRGEHTHWTKTENSKGQTIYRKSKLNSDVIYTSNRNPEVSENKFSEILNRNTHYVEESDEVIQSIETIFNNEEEKYPFKPKTIIVSKNITNTTLLDWLNAVDDKGNSINIDNLEKELINKYYAEIKDGLLTIHIKFPKDTEFRELGNKSNTDIIGSTLDHMNEHIIDIFYVENSFDKIKKDEYLIRINNVFFIIRKSGSSYIRTAIEINSDDYSNNMFHVFTFLQYTLPTPTKEEEKLLKNTIVGTSLEDYCGIYFKIGDKFIDGKPIPANITKRNLPGARFYRGILDMKTPSKTKMMLGLQGLKSNFNLGSMQNLELIIKQCCIIYNNFHKKFKDNLSDFRGVDPREYCEVKTSNQKSDKKDTAGIMYLRVVGKNFYKLGITRTSCVDRLLKKESPADIQSLKQEFPLEDIYDGGKQYLIYTSREFDACGSTEQKIKELIVQMDDVVTYDHKTGGDIREFFHCDSESTVNEIRNVMIASL